MTEDLATWLLEQIAEDERVAYDSGPARVAWATYRHEDGSMRYTSPVAEHGDVWIADGRETEPTSVRVVFDPARVLAECGVKRRIIQLWQDLDEDRSAWLPGAPDPRSECDVEVDAATAGVADTVLQLLALPYADRPGWHKGWRP